MVRDDGTSEVLEQMKRYAGLDQKMVEALIENVVVYDPEHVEIRWKFSDEILRFIMEQLRKGCPQGCGWLYFFTEKGEYLAES